MKREKMSSVTMQSLIFKGKLSSRVFGLHLHFYENGPEKLDLSSYLRSAIIWRFFPDPQHHPDWVMLIGSGRASKLTLASISVSEILIEMQLRFRRAWMSSIEDECPLINICALSGGTVHMIVNCAPGTTSVIKGMCADSLRYFNDRRGGLSLTPEIEFKLPEGRLMSQEEINSFLERHEF
jgi:hypothetical protein